MTIRRKVITRQRQIGPSRELIVAVHHYYWTHSLHAAAKVAAVASKFTFVRASLLALGLSLSAHPAWAIDPVKIGATVAQSPPGAGAQQVRDGLDIALKIINDGGGVLGRPFELVFYDTAPDRAATAVEKLIGQDRVVAIVGEHNSASALAGLDIAHRHKVPYITAARSHAIAEKLYPEIY